MKQTPSKTLDDTERKRDEYDQFKDILITLVMATLVDAVVSYKEGKKAYTAAVFVYFPLRGESQLSGTKGRKERRNKVISRRRKH